MRRGGEKTGSQRRKRGDGGEGGSRANEDSGRNVVEYAQVIAGKNEVTLKFHQAENAPLSMMEIRFYVPDKEEEEEDPVAGFKEEVMTRANIRPDTGDVIVSFAEIQSLRPR